MELRVYNGEHFERTNTRFIGFGIALLAIIALSVWRMNFFGAIVMFLVAWWYVLFWLTKNKIISLIIREAGIAIDTRMRVWNTLQNFAVEVDEKTQTWKNIIIVQEKWDIMIFSISDTQEKTQAFIELLQKYIPMVEMPDLPTIEKISRKLKL